MADDGMGLKQASVRHLSCVTGRLSVGSLPEGCRLKATTQNAYGQGNSKILPSQHEDLCSIPRITLEARCYA